MVNTLQTNKRKIMNRATLLCKLAVILGTAVPAFAWFQCGQTLGDTGGVVNADENSCAWQYNGGSEPDLCAGVCRELSYTERGCIVAQNPAPCQYCDPEVLAPENVVGLLNAGSCQTTIPADETITPECICVLSGNLQFIQHPVNSPSTGFECEECREGS